MQAGSLLHYYRYKPAGHPRGARMRKALEVRDLCGNHWRYQWRRRLFNGR